MPGTHIQFFLTDDDEVTVSSTTDVPLLCVQITSPSRPGIEAVYFSLTDRLKDALRVQVRQWDHDDEDDAMPSHLCGST